MFFCPYPFRSDGDACVGSEMATRIVTGGPKPLPEETVAKYGFSSIHEDAVENAVAA